MFLDFVLTLFQEADFICMLSCLLNGDGQNAYVFVRELCVKVNSLLGPPRICDQTRLRVDRPIQIFLHRTCRKSLLYRKYPI